MYHTASEEPAGDGPADRPPLPRRRQRADASGAQDWEGETVEGEFVILAGTPRTRSAPTMEDPTREGDPPTKVERTKKTEEQQPLMIGGHTALPKVHDRRTQRPRRQALRSLWARQVGEGSSTTSQRHKDQRWTPTTRPTTAGQRKHRQPKVGHTTRCLHYDTGYQGLPDQPSRANHLGNSLSRKGGQLREGLAQKIIKTATQMDNTN